MRKILLPFAFITLLSSCGDDKESEKNEKDKATTESRSDRTEKKMEKTYDVADFVVMNYYDDQGGEGFATPEKKPMFGGKRFDKAFPFKEGMAKVGKDQEGTYLYTFINPMGEEISDYKYHDMGYFHDGLVWFQTEKDGPYGYMNQQGNEVLAAQYLNNWDFNNGLAMISNEPFNRYMNASPEILFGFINVKGDTIVPMKYVYAKSFGNGLAPIFDGNDVIYIDTTGAQAINQKFENGAQFCDGLAPVTLKDKVGFINPNGEFVIEPQYSNYKFMFKYGDFSEYFDENERSYATDQGYMIVSKGDTWGIITKDNETVVDFIYADIDIPEGDYVMVKSIKKKEKYSTEYYKGLYDLKNKKEVIPAKFDEVEGFYNDETDWMKVGLKTKEDGYGADLFGFYNKVNGQFIEPAYDEVEVFSEGLAAVKKGEKWGYVNEEGELVIDFRFDYHDEFEEGRAYVKLDDDYYYIDKTGRKVD